MRHLAVLLALGIRLAHPLTAQSSLTAQQVTDTILKASASQEPPPNPPNPLIDTFKAGDPSTPVTGIATTFTPTMDVLRQAVAHHINLIVTHEPTWYNHADSTALFTNDSIYKEKLAYINDHHLVIWRFHDNWHRRPIDGIAEGFAAQAGWQQYENPGPPQDKGFFYTLPRPTTVLELAKYLQARFHARAIRVIGDPALSVTQVAYMPGASGEVEHVQALERKNVQVLIAGEAREWETVEYVRDATLQDRPKALILLGHLSSEEPGMDNCATWLKTLFPTLKIEFIPAGEPYWTPEKPASIKRH